MWEEEVGTKPAAINWSILQNNVSTLAVTLNGVLASKILLVFRALGACVLRLVEACCTKFSLKLSNKIHALFSLFIMKVPPQEALTLYLCGSVKPS
jgi:hypothetical protein